MIRKIGILIGLFFTIGALWSFFIGTKSYITDPPAPLVAQVFHKTPQHLSLPSDGPFGKFDNQQLQRGFQVYNEVCKACHALQHVAFRDLEQIGYNKAEVKAIAAEYQIPHYDPNTGEVTTEPGKPTDHFPPVAYAGTGHPPDLSLITKAREGGASYVHALLTGFQDPPAAMKQQFPDSVGLPGLYFNPYFASLNIAMPPPLTAEGQVTYADGTKATVNQMATDVSAFLVWTAEPTLEQRRQVGWPVLGFLLFLTVLTYLAYRNVWADKKKH
jgi:ubiquinol-cytochrome c reductase cytochrome c1 subunit